MSSKTFTVAVIHDGEVLDTAQVGAGVVAEEGDDFQLEDLGAGALERWAQKVISKKVDSMAGGY